jgi:hypothetical protein
LFFLSVEFMKHFLLDVDKFKSLFEIMWLIFFMIFKSCTWTILNVKINIKIYRLETCTIYRKFDGKKFVWKSGCMWYKLNENNHKLNISIIPEKKKIFWRMNKFMNLTGLSALLNFKCMYPFKQVFWFTNFTCTMTPL